MGVTHGRNGTFLSSVAALSILSITSHHKNHLQHARLILHHSRPAARLVPPPLHQHLSNREHGTRVSVQDLFGNMPVRVKQRTMGAELAKEDERQFETLKKQIVGLLLAWNKPVSVTLKSAESSKRMSIRGNAMCTTGSAFGDTSTKKLDLPSICSILSQAGIIEPSNWDAWIKTSARTAWVNINGVISLQPAPSKKAQFLSIGIHPVSSEMGSNVLYDEINRLFTLSNFGSQEDATDSTDDKKERRSQDGRFKKEGFTNKQVRGGGKGVDRWPMFFIQIDIDNTRLCPKDNMDMLGEGIITRLIKVLGMMVTSFLEENHFRPRARLACRKQDDPIKLVAMEKGPIGQISGVTMERSKAAHSTLEDHDFGSWSRMKIGKGAKASGASPLSSSAECQAGTARSEGSQTKDLPEESLGAPQNLECSSIMVEDPTIDCVSEPVLEWRHPTSGAPILVNARTGQVIPPRPLQRPISAPSKHSSSASSSPFLRTIDGCYPSRLTRRFSNPLIMSSATAEEGSWSSKLLKKWENPIFKTTEEIIPQVSFDGPTIETSDLLHGRHHCCSDLEIQKAFTQASTSVSARISKQSLNEAKVISQVDKKFILICVSRSLDPESGGEAELLVLVDQHAADERIRVEGLLAELKASPLTLAQPLIFEIHSREQALLSRLAPSFAALGIVYDLENAPARSSKGRIIVKTLPGVIAERCRLEPNILIKLIRTEAWKLDDEEEGGARGALAAIPTTTPKSPTSYPQGLLDMLNSRACRSAIMFNDPLTTHECRTLIARLAKCDFPFQCAHGRPSMVPLVDLGASSSSAFKGVGIGGREASRSASGSDEDRGPSSSSSFGKAWRVWRD